LTTLVVKTVRYWPTPVDRHRRWRLFGGRQNPPTYTLLALLDERNEKPTEFLLLPQARMRPNVWNVGQRFLAKHEAFRCQTFDEAKRRLIAVLLSPEVTVLPGAYHEALMRSR
jgi:hypothetical protein